MKYIKITWSILKNLAIYNRYNYLGRECFKYHEETSKYL